MYTLYHHPFCPHSRFIRLVLGEHGLDLRLVEERAWERREGFLALNPAATTPVLLAEGFPPIPSAGIIAEYLDETHGMEAGERRLLPVSMAARVEGCMDGDGVSVGVSRTSSPLDRRDVQPENGTRGAQAGKAGSRTHALRKRQRPRRA